MPLLINQPLEARESIKVKIRALSSVEVETYLVLILLIWLH